MIFGVSSTLSALGALDTKTAVRAHNVANTSSDGFKKSRPVLEEGPGGTVRARVSKVETPGPLLPVQGEEGMEIREGSNVDLTEEIPDLMLTRRHFEANLKIIQTDDEMLGSLLDIVG
ncbi:MAG: flagellar biosynthesis protein FlgC [Deltaproteobacteria bacterium]|nr:flagellar biosynthesis protein FlgC [Deltaproteobacteria bacterium]MBW1921945.1 flagellar biosynthesis protein FlgC [Deltaproteobacteria bacterium]MBW1948787.1 flagellar biosynthesis protein FlgC [Deltaproteobacteria bacterium]MBW2006464.1 flagellar biosynthesis protein FlgC [Deltaproteobacteria bacterium]MBW2101160.1 flagellar biosynthesis protein FlgC [Deltaproteobacteria bacterium]